MPHLFRQVIVEWVRCETYVAKGVGNFDVAFGVDEEVKKDDTMSDDSDVDYLGG